MKAIVGAAFIASTLLVEGKEPEAPGAGCNKVQERIMERINDLRKYDKEHFVYGCVEGTMRFAQPGQDFGFIITPDGLVRVCKAQGEGVLCLEPKEEEDAISALKKLYSKGKIEI